MKGKRRLLAVMEADVAGYSLLVARDQAATSKLMTARRRHFDHYAQKFKGTLVNQTGDAFLLTFNSAFDAMQAAVEIQRLYKDYQRVGKGRMPVHFRIGIDLGDVWEEQPGQPVGNAVNTAARLEALADPGGICISAAVYGQVAGRINLEFEDGGDRVLKNLPAPVRVYKASVYTVREQTARAGFPRAGAGSRKPISPAKQASRPTSKQAAKAPDWERFMEEAYQVIRSRFKDSSRELRKRGWQVVFRKANATRFTCSAGNGTGFQAQAKIWLEQAPGADRRILYADHHIDSDDGHSWDMALGPARNRQEPALWATGSPIGPHHQDFDLSRLSPDQAAEYFWRMFAMFVR